MTVSDELYERALKHAEVAHAALGRIQVLCLFAKRGEDVTERLEAVRDEMEKKLGQKAWR